MAVDDEDLMRMLLADRDYAGVAVLLAELATARRQEKATHPRNCPCRHCQSCRKRQAAAATRAKWAGRPVGGSG